MGACPFSDVVYEKRQPILTKTYSNEEGRSDEEEVTVDPSIQGGWGKDVFGVAKV